MPSANSRKRGDDVLSPAMALLRREGPSSLTMRRVGDEAGVTATALYRHFKDKDALLSAVIRNVYRLFLDALGDAPPNGSPELRLQLAAGRFLRFALDHPNYYRLLFLEPHGLHVDRYPGDFHSGKSAGFRQLRDLVADGMRLGVLKGKPARDAADVALTIYAHMHGHVALFLAGRFPNPRVFRRFYEESFDRLLNGLRRR